MIDLDELEKAAVAATPGPWWTEGGAIHAGQTVLDMSSATVVAYCMKIVADEKYIALANPDTTLTLIACARAVLQSQQYANHRRICKYCKGLHDCIEANRIKAVSWSMTQAALAGLAGKE